MSRDQVPFRDVLSAWIRRNRVSTTLVLAGAAVAMLVYRSELRPPLPGELQRQDVRITHVGQLERTVSGGNRQRFNFQTDAGLGVGFANEHETNALIRQHYPIRFVPFASSSKPSEAELSRIVVDRRYWLTFWRHEIVEVAELTGSAIVPIERLTSSIERNKVASFVAGVLLLVLTVTYFCVATMLQRSADRGGTDASAPRMS